MPRVDSIAAALRSPWEWRSVGQVQRRVGGVQVRRALGGVGEALDVNGAEHRGEAAVVARLDAAVADTVAAVDHLDALLALGAQVEVVLESRRRSLGPSVCSVFQLAVGERTAPRCLRRSRRGQR